MNISKSYVVYELNRIMGNESYLSLAEVEFKGSMSNRFETEDEAIQAIIEDELSYEDYIILRQVYLAH